MSNNHFSKNHFEKEIVTLGRTNPVLNVANDTAYNIEILTISTTNDERDKWWLDGRTRMIYAYIWLTMY